MCILWFQELLDERANSFYVPQQSMQGMVKSTRMAAVYYESGIYLWILVSFIIHYCRVRVLECQIWMAIIGLKRALKERYLFSRSVTSQAYFLRLLTVDSKIKFC